MNYIDYDLNASLMPVSTIILGLNFLGFIQTNGNAVVLAKRYANRIVPTALPASYPEAGISNNTVFRFFYSSATKMQITHFSYELCNFDLGRYFYPMLAFSLFQSGCVYLLPSIYYAM